MERTGSQGPVNHPSSPPSTANGPTSQQTRSSSTSSPPVLSDLPPANAKASPSNTPLVESPTSEEPPEHLPNNAQDDKGVEANAHNSTSAELTPLRAHYLKKELVLLQFRRELGALTTVPRNNISTFSYLGPPFTPPPKDGPPLDLPFLRFMFRKFVLSFPFLAAAPRDFFPDKLQPFMANLLSRNFSSASPLDTDPDNSEEATRAKLLTKLERNFSLLITSGTKLVEEEEVVRLTQKDLDRLEMLARKRAARDRKLKDMFEVNVVCVRTIIEKKRVRSKAHDVRCFPWVRAHRVLNDPDLRSSLCAPVVAISQTSLYRDVMGTLEHLLMKYVHGCHDMSHS